MGKVTDSLLAGTQGRTGRVVISNIQGHEISRARPRRRNRTSTPAQQLVKNRFNFAINLIQGYKEVAKQFYGKRAGLKSPYNMAMGNLLKAAPLDTENLMFTFRPELVEFTKGNLPQPQPIGLTSNNPLEVTINWQNNGFEPEHDNNTLYIMYAEGTPTQLKSAIHKANATRADETYTFLLPPNLQGAEIYCWISFVDSNSKEAAISAYLGTITVS